MFFLPLIQTQTNEQKNGFFHMTLSTVESKTTVPYSKSLKSKNYSYQLLDNSYAVDASVIRN